MVGGLVGVCFVGGFGVGKYIGVEALLTVQLLYYSQLLVGTADKWPIAF